MCFMIWWNQFLPVGSSSSALTRSRRQCREQTDSFKWCVFVACLIKLLETQRKLMLFWMRGRRCSRCSLASRFEPHQRGSFLTFCCGGVATALTLHRHPSQTSPQNMHISYPTEFSCGIRALSEGKHRLVMEAHPGRKKGCYLGRTPGWTRTHLPVGWAKRSSVCWSVPPTRALGICFSDDSSLR